MTPLELACECKVIENKDGDLVLEWHWPCKDHRQPPYKCEATEYVDSYKLHGCLKVKCKDCNAEYCPHWPMCPKCMIQKVKV